VEANLCRLLSFVYKCGAVGVVIMIVWQLDLQLPMQSVPIATNVVVRILLRRGVLDITLCDKVCQWLAAGVWFSPGTRFPPPIKLSSTI